MAFGPVARFVGVLVAVCAIALAADHADAKTKKKSPAAPVVYSTIVVDAKTGKTLQESRADQRRYPASLTKMMTLYLLFEDLERKKVSLSTRFTVSEHASAQPPSKLGLKPGDTIAAKDAILAVVTRSANDVAVVIAENLNGSESAFASRMTSTARSIGMSDTTFRNASGLPNSGQVTTARDMAVLGRALQDRFPQYYTFFSTRSFVWNGHSIGNHNRLLGRVKGVDGIKTGYTRASGFNLVTSVNRDNRRVVAVVLGGKTGKGRDAQMASLVGKYFTRASRGSQTSKVIVASATADSTAGGGADSSMLPRPRPIASQLATVASSAGASAAVTAVIVEAASRAPVPAAAPVRADAVDAIGALALAEGDIDEDSPAPALAARPIVTQDTWKIQIGAMPSKSAALSALAEARKAAPIALASVEPYAEAIASKGTTLYRARFAGFDSKDAARSACVNLASKDFSCLALR